MVLITIRHMINNLLDHVLVSLQYSLIFVYARFGRAAFCSPWFILSILRVVVFSLKRLNLGPTRVWFPLYVESCFLGCISFSNLVLVIFDLGRVEILVHRCPYGLTIYLVRNWSSVMRCAITNRSVFQWKAVRYQLFVR